MTWGQVALVGYGALAIVAYAVDVARRAWKRMEGRG